MTRMVAPGIHRMVLPDFYTIFRLQIELVAFLDPERLVPGVHVAQRQLAARSGRGVRIGEHLGPQRIVADLSAPGLRVGEEEALIAREAVDHRRFPAAERE